MRVISTFLPPQFDESVGAKTVLTAFDTLVDEKSIVVGITVGLIKGPTVDDALVTPTGMKIIARVMDHQALNYPDAPVVVFAGVQTVGNAVKRVRNLLEKAPHHSTLIIVCADDKVYDAAVTGLGVDFKSANIKPQ